MTDYGYRMRAGRSIFFRQESAPLKRPHTQHVKIIAGDGLAPNLLDLLFASQLELCKVVSRKPRENFVALTKVQVAWI